MNGFRGPAALARASWLAFGVLVGAALPLSVAVGQTSTWNNPTSGDWKTATNWKPARVPDGKKAAVILPSILTKDTTISVDKMYTLYSLAIDSSDPNGAYTIRSDAAGKGALEKGALAIIDEVTISSENNAKNTIALPIIASGDVPLDIINAGTARLTISGVISSAKMQGVTVRGEGEVLLTGNNTYKGGTVVNGGNLSIQNDAALGARDAGIVLTQFGLLRGIGTNASVSENRTISLGNAIFSPNGILAGDPDGTGTFTVNAKIATNGTGDGVLGILDRVRLTNTNSTFTVSNGIVVGNATTEGVLYLKGNVEANTDQVLGNPGNAIVLIKGTIVAESTFTSNRTIMLELPGTIGVIAGKTLTWAGPITGGNSNLRKTGPGTLILQGTNTFNHLLIARGTAAVSADTNLGKTDSSVGIANGAVLRVDSPFATDRGVTIKGSGQIDANFANNAAAGMDFNVKGQVSGGTLIKSGTGILTLSNANNSQSATEIMRGGALAVSADGDLGPTTSSVQIDGGGVLRVTDSFTTARKIIDTGSSPPGTIFVLDGKTLTVNSGITAGAAGLLKDGAGTLTLAKGSTSNVGLAAQVMAGKLVIDGTFSTFKGLLNAAGGEVEGGGTIQGTFDNKGKVTPGKDPGTLTVTGNVMMEANSHFGLDINAANGGQAGGSIGWGLLNVGSELDLLGKVTLDLQTYSLTGNADPIDPGLFNPLSSYSWEFAEAADGIFGFSPSLFAIDLSGFENPMAPPSSFSVVEQGDGLFLEYSPASVPEPSSYVLLLCGIATILAVGRARGNRRVTRPDHTAA